jgi:hypothetical protein
MLEPCFRYGYPDERHLTRVQEELAIKGVTEKDLTDTQKKFIENPNSVVSGSLFMDFAHLFSIQPSKGFGTAV